jgi:hypothetical protein
LLKNRPRPSAFLPLAREALLLLLLATGWRVNDAAKLGGKVRFDDEAAIFYFVEKRKCRIKGTYTVSQAVKRFLSSPRLCPVEAISFFLKCERKVRANDDFLFVSSTGRRATKDTLRRWVLFELKLAGIDASAGSCRSASTSLALERNVPINIIMKSAGWSSENTFRQYYQKCVARGTTNKLDGYMMSELYAFASLYTVMGSQVIPCENPIPTALPRNGEFAERSGGGLGSLAKSRGIGSSHPAFPPEGFFTFSHPVGIFDYGICAVTISVSFRKSLSSLYSSVADILEFPNSEFHY